MKNTIQHTELTIILSYLKEVFSWRFKNPNSSLNEGAPELNFETLNNTFIAQYINEHKLNKNEVIVLLIALSPHLLPNFLIDTVTDEFPEGSDFPLFGGVKGKNHRGILPTGETIQFIIGGINLDFRNECLEYFSDQHIFSKQQILYLEPVPIGEPVLSGKLILHFEIFYLLTKGEYPLPKLSPDFPAEKLETPLTWSDMVLNSITLEYIKDIEIWLQYNDILLNQWAMKSRIKPGYRALFYGPPGTGKTLIASLLGKYTKRPVYRIDLSTVVSKYIGETEKNLANLFNKAANKNWILFFDEADSIFGKRTNVRDAHDKYANQEVSYLLQRIETHPGLVILASNFKDNIDDAFTRRFQSLVPFELPGAKERKQIWEKNLPQQITISEDVDMDSIAKKYELSGSNIVNIIHYCSLKVLSLESEILTNDILIDGIKKEYLKEDRLF
ncbi:MAG: ATP-binding protein [Flavobacteriaceae bacterium]|nr:ATP-binding protein [Flavobacteriaceae bacterium]